MISDLARKYSRYFLEPLARFISRTGISPNFITSIGFLFTAFVAVVIGLGHLQLGGLLLIASAGVDAIDGILARLSGRTSRFGAFLDSSLDRYAEAITFLGLFIYLDGQGAQVELGLIYIAIVGSFMVSYTRARAEAIGLDVKVGILTRFERITVLIIGLILSPYQIGGYSILLIALLVLAIFANFTAAQRIWKVWRITGGEDGG